QPSDGRVLRSKLSSLADGTSDSCAPKASHRFSYQLTSGLGGDRDYQAALTPSPPDRTAGKSQAHFAAPAAAGGDGTPTMQRRRTALATLGWPSTKGRAHESRPSPHPPPPPL